jgi:exonuclease SbcC
MEARQKSCRGSRFGRAAFAAKEAEFKVLGPLWDEAAALDSQILSAETELTTANAAAEAAETEAQLTGAALSKLRAAVTEVEAELSEADAEIAGLEAARPLADRWDQIRADILAHAEAQTAADRARTQALGAEAKLRDFEVQAEALTAVIKGASDKELALQAEAAQLSEQITALERQHPVQAARQLADLAAALGAMHRAGADYASAQQDQTLAIAQEHSGLAGMTAAIAAITAASEAFSRAEAQVAILVAPSQQADLALSEAARNLRLHLEPGAPCPVCGSSEHPIHADNALADLAARLRTDLTAARAAAHKALASRTEAERQHAIHDAQRAQAKMAIAATTARMEKARGDWNAARSQALAHPGCPVGIPDTLGTDNGAIEAAQLRIATAQLAEAEAQDNLGQMRRYLADMATRRDALREDMKARATDREKVTLAKADANRVMELARQAEQSHQTAAERYASAVSPFLVSLHEADNALDDPGLLARLENLVDRVTKAREAQQVGRALLAELAQSVRPSQ